MRFIKPLDVEMIIQTAKNHKLIVTLEENAIIGGAGSMVNQVLNQHNMQVGVLNLGIPDYFVEHGSRAQMLASCQLDYGSILLQIQKKLATTLAITGGFR